MARRVLTLPTKTQVDLDRQELADLLSDARFVAFLWRLLGAGKAGIYHSTYSGSPHDTSFREGQRALGLMVLDECLSARPDTLVLLATEGLSRATTLQPQPPGAADEHND